MDAQHRQRRSTKIIRVSHDIEVYKGSSAKSLAEAVAQLPDAGAVTGFVVGDDFLCITVEIDAPDETRKA